MKQAFNLYAHPEIPPGVFVFADECPTVQPLFQQWVDVFMYNYDIPLSLCVKERLRSKEA